MVYDAGGAGFEPETHLSLLAWLEGINSQVSNNDRNRQEASRCVLNARGDPRRHDILASICTLPELPTSDRRRPSLPTSEWRVVAESLRSSARGSRARGETGHVSTDERRLSRATWLSRSEETIWTLLWAWEEMKEQTGKVEIEFTCVIGGGFRRSTNWSQSSLGH